MDRKVTNKDLLLEMIQKRINNSDELDSDCRHVIATSIYWHEKDDTGSNWGIHSFRNAYGCEDVMIHIVEEFKRLYNIEDE